MDSFTKWFEFSLKHKRLCFIAQPFQKHFLNQTGNIRVGTVFSNIEGREIAPSIMYVLLIVISSPTFLVLSFTTNVFAKVF